jgi:predicted transposase YdaD
MERRIDSEAPSGDAAELWIATYVLMGLRYDQTVAGKLLGGVRAMKESSTYQAILSEGRTEGIELGRQEGRVEGRQEGRAEEARSLLLRLGALRFGSPDESIKAAITAVPEIQELEVLLERLLKAESWDELLHTGSSTIRRAERVRLRETTTSCRTNC